MKGVIETFINFKATFERKEGDDMPDEYEILPHQEIEQLRKELESLREMDVTPAKKLHISIVELNRNIEKLLDIFEEAIHEIKVEEGGIMFSDKIKPVLSRLDRVEKNMESMADVLSNVIAPAISDLHDNMTGGSPPRGAPDEVPPPFDIPPPPGR